MKNLVIKSSDYLAVQIDQLKAHLRIIHNYDNAYLENIINMATNILENKISDSILIKTYQYTNDVCLTSIIKLPIQNVIEILSVTSNNENIFFDRKSKNELLLHHITSNINVTYTAGITNDPKDIPLDLQYAILEIARNIYEQNTNKFPDEINDIVNKYKSLEI